MIIGVDYPPICGLILASPITSYLVAPTPVIVSITNSLRGFGRRGGLSSSTPGLLCGRRRANARGIFSSLAGVVGLWIPGLVEPGRIGVPVGNTPLLAGMSVAGVGQGSRAHAPCTMAY